MNQELWQIWFDNEQRREEDYRRYLETRKIKPVKQVKALVQGHLEKADHNLKFTRQAMKLEEYNDWALVSAYYAIYHAALALCALKGHSTKDHQATLLLLIKEF